MNDKMCSLRQSDIAMLFALELAGLTDLAKEQERKFSNNTYGSIITNMLQAETERTSNYYIETNLSYSKYNSNRLLFQENIFLDKESDDESRSNDVSQVNAKEINKVALIQDAMSRMALKYMSIEEDSFSLLPVLVYLGADLPNYFTLSHRLPYKSHEDNPFKKYELTTNKSFLFLDVRRVDWKKTIELRLDKVPEAERLLLCYKIIFASYYQTLLSLYDSQVDKIHYPLHKLQGCIKYLLESDRKQYYPYVTGILDSLSDKVSLFHSSKRIDSKERYEIDKILVEYLSVTNF